MSLMEQMISSATTCKFIKLSFLQKLYFLNFIYRSGRDWCDAMVWSEKERFNRAHY